MKKKMVAIICALTFTSLLGAASVDRASGTLFSGTVAALTKKGEPHRLRMTISRWDLNAAEDDVQTMSFHTFTIINVCSGRVETTIDGKIAIRNPEDYWTMKAGSIIRVRVLSESSILQTLTVAP